MLFNSLHYLIFLPAVTLVYFQLSCHQRRCLLLFASFYFYFIFSIPLSLLLVFSTILDYCAARGIQNSRSERWKKFFLFSSVCGNLSMLAFFKYLNFLNDSLTAVLGAPLLPVLDVVLPMGISFYTFQTMSYTFDVYRGRLAARRSLIDVALYVSFFPQLVAGPIMRGESLMPQLMQHHPANLERILSGSFLVVYGLLKKVFLADPLGEISDSVFGTSPATAQIDNLSALSLIFGTYAFAIQIYCDFSAYSDIAIGSARILGYRLVKNFDSPYLAVSVRDFWRRWHISLSTWLRDYLYIPLGGSRGTKARTYVNLLITMLLGGLWHGASWTFVIWGGMHGIALSIERLMGLDKFDVSEMSLLQRLCRRVLTFHFICATWIFFRCTDFQDAVTALIRIVTAAAGESPVSWIPPVMLLGLIIIQLLKNRYKMEEVVSRRPALTRWFIYAGVFVLIIALLGGRSPEFIYFQF